ncbi:RNA-directed DNA polymerase, eukaryota, reverse transcriptase zinc-binding domain protein [Tanacetum coccineum]
MGDSEWIEVRSKKHGSVFNRLKFPQPKASMVDDLAKISLSVYVSNFPSHLTVRELWNICGKKGLSWMFLLPSIRIKWDRYLDFVSSSRFNRKVDVKSSKVDRPKDDIACKASYPSLANSYVNVARNSSNNHGNSSSSHHDASGIKTTIALSQETSHDFPLALLGCYKDFHSIVNTHTMCSAKGFLGIDFKYLGGLWVLFDFNSKDVRDKFLNHNGITSWFSTLKPWHDDFVVEERLIWLEIEGVPIRAWNNEIFTQIYGKWGEVLFMDGSDQWNRLFKRLCIKSSHPLLRNDQDIDEVSSNGVYEKHEDHLFDENDVEPAVELKDNIKTGEEVHDQNMNDKVDVPTDVSNGMNNLPVNSDPFGLGPLINKKSFKGPKEHHSDTPEFPPGFSPVNDDHQSSESINNLSGGDAPHPGFSLLGKLEETIKVGLALGLNMERCEKPLASLIADKGDFVDGIIVMMGDLNEVREAIERFGKSFNDRQATLFNDFINDASLFDIPFGGFNYTWTDKWGSKMSKLDRFLVSDNFYEVFPHSTGIVLEKGIPDHRPILLKGLHVDYGLTPFCFFHSWLELHGFRDLVVNTWKNDGIINVNDHQVKFSSIDIKIDQCKATEEDFKERRDSLTFLGNFDRMETRDLAQKAKVKWALEGDENSAIWDKIRSAIWDCGGDRVPGCNSSFIALIPKVSNAKHVYDFWPISLIGCQYKIIGKLLANRLSTVIGNCISPVQSSFIKGRNILHGSLILNEVLAWYRQCKKELMIFKVDSKKAFDSLRWDFLDLILDKLGFSIKWGLRQGDPMSHFLFILVMKGLPALTSKAEASGLFKERDQLISIQIHGYKTLNLKPKTSLILAEGPIWPIESYVQLILALRPGNDIP